MSGAALLSWTARILVAALFIVAAWGKIEHPLEFAQEIQAYQLVLVDWTHVMAFVIPWLELISAIVLIVGPWRAESRFLLFSMLLVFTAAKIWAEMKGMKINCGCFGGILGSLEKSLQGLNGIIFNAFLLGLLVLDFAVSQAKVQPRISVEGFVDRPTRSARETPPA
ncbi:MAG: DoxX family membrane protein [Planctomycetes bacterium]|nr:DoxX family membrane protein [Planctomycetota bacterium]